MKKDNGVRPPDLGANPFLQSLKIPFRALSKEEQGNRIHFKAEWSPITRIYVSARRRDRMMLLSLRAKELFLWIVYNIESGKDYIYIDRKKYMAEMDIGSVNTFKDAVRVLSRRNIIYPSIKKDIYWVNPHYLFHGNRIEYFPENLTYDTAVDKIEHPFIDDEIKEKERRKEAARKKQRD